MSGKRGILIDGTIVLVASVVGILVLASLVEPGVLPEPLLLAGVLVLVAVAIGLAVSRMASRPDHLRALQSHAILVIADRSLAYLRRGLDEETAGAVCRITLEHTEAAAIAITDTSSVLGFAGVGEDHHTVGGPIMTKATRDALQSNENRILATKDEIGCPKAGCPLRAAIVVPLEVRDRPVGTLKFYYTTPRLLNETQVAMAEGLAGLLSTQLELSELERQTELACRMELKALQAQINPHFLFNTINTIAMLIRTDPMKARGLLREFARFYRRMLEHNEGLVTVREELDYTRSYLTFERARFGKRLVTEVDVADDALDVEVPAFIVQPLVENCVQHAMPPEGPLHIRVTGHRDGDTVTIVVSDDGVGIKAADLPRVMQPGFGRGLGIALKNIDDRLKGHFGQGCGFALDSVEGEGTTATLTLVMASAAEGGDDAQSARGR